MSKKEISSQDVLRATTEKILTKYTSVQLLGKLRSGSFLKLSKEIAVAILETRGEDVSEFKVEEEPKKTTFKKVQKPIEVKPEPGVNTITDIDDEKVEVIENEDKKDEKQKPDQGKPKVKSKNKKSGNPRKKRVPNIKLTEDQKAKILDLSKEGKTIFKISNLLGLNWYRVRDVVEPK